MCIVTRTYSISGLASLTNGSSGARKTLSKLNERHKLLRRLSH